MKTELINYHYLFKKININKIIFLIILFITYSNTYSATRYVNYNASGANNGASWANAFTSLQSAFDVATSGDQIWIAKGTYVPSYDYGLGGGNRYYHFRLTDGVAIYGGFAGTETAISQRATYGEGEANETILSGDLNGDDSGLSNISDNCYHVIYNPSGTTLTISTTVDGLSIVGGNSNTPGGIGGLIYFDQDNKTAKLVGVTLRYASAWSAGAAIALNNSSIELENCYMHEVVSTHGVFQTIGSTNIRIKNTKFRDCYAHNGDGAVFFSNASTVTVSNCLFYDNLAHGNAGVISNSWSNFTFNNCTFSNNRSSTSGVLYSSVGNTTFNNCIMYNNNKNEYNQDHFKVFLIDNGSSLTFNYSCYELTANYLTSNNGSTSNLTNNNITSDPLFVDGANDDYRLSYNSPCLDAGNNSYISETYDVRGASYSRKLNKSSGISGTVDIGSYEFKAGYDALTITHNSLSSKKGKSVKANASFLATAVPSVTAAGYVWSTSSGPTIALTTKTSSLPSSSSFTDDITGLSYGTTYYLKAYATNSVATYYSDEIIFTTYTSEQEIETLAPNDGDGDNDGTPDSEQSNVASLKNNFTDKYITIKSLNGNSITNTEIQSASDDNQYYYPGSLSKFTISGSTARVKLYFHNVSSLHGYSYRKKKANGGFFNFTNYTFDTEVINGKTVATATLNLTDGGPEDYDGVVNGVIVDPGGPAILSSVASIPVWDDVSRYSFLLILLVFGLYKLKKNI